MNEDLLPHHAHEEHVDKALDAAYAAMRAAFQLYASASSLYLTLVQIFLRKDAPVKGDNDERMP